MLLGCAGAILAALASAPTASAASIDHGASFAVRCNFSHRDYDDPINFPGQPGLSHSHDFFGNLTTAASSTYQSMTASGATTTCSRPEDTAGYWIPTVSWKDSTGTYELTANRGVFYYRAGFKNYRTVQPFAKDLRDINADRITWFCGINDAGAGSATPPTQCSGGVLSLKIVFPDCVAQGDLSDPNLKPVDPTSNYRAGELINPATGQVIDPDTGQVIDSPDHKVHMAESKLQNGVRVCPSDHPIPVPTLTVTISFPMRTRGPLEHLESGRAVEPEPARRAQLRRTKRPG